MAVWMLRTKFDPGTTIYDNIGNEAIPDSVHGHIQQFDPSGDVEAQGRALLSIIYENPHYEPISFGEVKVVTIPHFTSSF